MFLLITHEWVSVSHVFLNGFNVIIQEFKALADTFTDNKLISWVAVLYHTIESSNFRKLQLMNSDPVFFSFLLQQFLERRCL